MVVAFAETRTAWRVACATAPASAFRARNAHERGIGEERQRGVTGWPSRTQVAVQAFGVNMLLNVDRRLPARGALAFSWTANGNSRQ